MTASLKEYARPRARFTMRPCALAHFSPRSRRVRRALAFALRDRRARGSSRCGSRSRRSRAARRTRSARIYQVAPSPPRAAPGTLPDGDVCVHLPGDPESSEDALAAENAHRERTGRWAVYEQIPRRPDRPASYDAYRYPVPPGLPDGHFVVSGYDLDRPDESQRRGRSLHATGHGGVDLPIRAVPR